MSGKRRKLPHWKRKLILEKYNFKCYWCEKVFIREQVINPFGYIMGQTNWTLSVHIDHLIPVSKGGDDEINNLVLSCAKCNLTKYNNIWPSKEE